MTTQRDKIRAKRASVAAETEARKQPDKDGFQFYSGRVELVVVQGGDDQ